MKSRGQRLRPDAPTLYPLLIWLYPPLAIYAANASQIPVVELPGALAVFLLIGLGIGMLLRRVLAAEVAAVVLWATGALFGFFGHIVLAVTNALIPYARTINNEVLIRHDAVVVLSLVGLMILLILGRKIRRVPSGASTGLTIFSIVLLIQPVVALVLHATHRPPPASSSSPLPTSETVSTTPQAQTLPDIYYIVPDGYSRPDVYARFYHEPLQEFRSRLRELRFEVPHRSSSNYYWTFLSIASALNMRYVEDLRTLAEVSTDKSPAYRLIRDNAVARTLKSWGYRYIHLTSTFPATARNPFADRVVSCQTGFFASDYRRVLVETTWLVVFERWVGGGLAACHRETFRNLAALASEPGPKFVFSHMILPHHPYLFDADGSTLKEATISNQFDFQNRLWSNRKAYLAQTQFLNKQLLATVEDILRRSVREPIIIIHSDHGALLTADESDVLPADEDAIRFANFTAVHLPAELRFSLPPDISSVELFRLILSRIGPVDIPPVDSVRHLKSGFLTPYDFTEIAHKALEERWSAWED